MNLQNWDKEIRKWLGGRVNALPVDSGGKDEIDRNLGLSDILSDISGSLYSFCR